MRDGETACHQKGTCNGKDGILLQVTTRAASAPAVSDPAKEGETAYFPGDMEAQVGELVLT